MDAAHLRRQLDISAGLLDLHLAGLEDAELLWRPATTGMHVRETDAGWVADWPERETYDVGPSSIAWITWHIGFWWSMVLDHSIGPATLRREDVRWPGSADATRTWLTGLRRQWEGVLDDLSPDQLASSAMTRWPMRDRPFVDVVAWVNVELMKNAAEIGYARFVYGARST
jgi:hypothetical protein